MRQRQGSSTQSTPTKATLTFNEGYKDKVKRPRRLKLSWSIVGFAFVSFLLIGVSRMRDSRMSAENIHEMKGYVPRYPPEKFTRVPEGHQKTFWTDGARITFPMTRALREHGWVKVNRWKDAQIVYQYKALSSMFTDLKPWQRFCHIPRYQKWNRKDELIDGFKDFEEETGNKYIYIPESYRLTVAEDRKAFKTVVRKKGGINTPWVLKQPRVNQGKGIEMIPPNSPRLLELSDKHVVEEEAPEYGYIIQRYICNEMTWNERKFDVRMFWFVASIDPLVVLYHDGYVRIGNADYSENNFEDTVSHLTTHTGLGEEGKATYTEFNDYIARHHRTSPELRHIRDPAQHVKRQFKDALAKFVEVFSEISLSHPGEDELVPENSFGFYGADFIVDSELDVWLIEPQKGCGLDEDYKMRVEMHDLLFGGIVDTLEEVWQKQEAGEAVLPLRNTGGWEILYGDGWRYKYEDYERSKSKRGCGHIDRTDSKRV